ncbi:MAG: tRNA pseudouridine(38-40) synthase TruA [Candidatus Omnitrophica bacterium]|nr:tRNA pseudouridine(38-40) synthase TruA [Candidatus Omnitrophota bacterium]
MTNFCLTLEYDGTGYSGWQIQKGKVKTIQGILEDALFTIFHTKIRVISSSRTDSGVHARGHVANFKARTRMNARQVKRALNSLLPGDILVKKVSPVPPSFNAQFDALSKTYRYTIWNREYVSPFMRRYVYHFKQPLDSALMKREARSLIGKHDFTSFKASDGKIKNPVRKVKRLDISGRGGLIEIRIEAHSFLYNMVRNIAGTLVEVGRGRLPRGSVKKILKKKDRKTAGPTAPASGLCLESVKYRS